MKRFLTRREALQDAAIGFGAMVVNSMFQQDRLFAADSALAKERIYDLRPKPPHFAAKAKRVIFIYIGGGPSTIDMFDPKPTLVKYDGKPAPFEIKGRALNGSQQIMASPWKFADCGENGRQVSELLPYFKKVVDKVTFVRSMTTDRIDHSTAQFTFVTGRGFTGFPSIGSWVSYALGTENQNLPAYIALGTGATIGDRAHSSAWLPPVFNGTSMRADPKTPIFDIKRPDSMSVDQQRRLLDTVEALDRVQKGQYPLDHDMESRIANYELAARMQLEALKVANLDEESEATKKLYGIDAKVGGPFSRLCLMARRLAEKDVRFVQIYGGGGGNWDTHNNIEGQLPGLCEYIDQGMSGLLIDLEQRGLLKDTLVVWSGEFGRLPTIEAKNSKPGRDHNPYGFSMWMAGAGLKPGFDYGQTDELGYSAARDFKCTHSDIHATVQHLLGIDYKKNTFPYEGRDESLVGVNPARVLTELYG
ncbi:MAG TPA: DUF1501 domain-containing protein [Bryobacteraceae bacterium]|nr:DUF1501 domain-containing protein [Bryobacteraceae bacterium]